MKRYSWLLLVCVGLFFAGCAPSLRNAQLDSHDPGVGYRFKNLAPLDNSDELFVILTFSGGGTRAAALSYGVLEHLARTEVRGREGRSQRLIEEVDVISSVSGGSFTGAYYALFGERLFTDFEARFLKQNIEAKLAGQLFSPVNWARLASPTYDRIDLTADYYDENIFDRKTFGDLLQKGRRPYVLINATDMSLGSRFVFTQDQFDLLCSDLSSVPVARAVAASSAFPVLLSPITLKNYAGACGYRVPEWVGFALEDRDIAGRRFSRALETRSYLDAVNRPYIHLIDGGIADNIGLRGPLDAISSLDSAWSVLRMINREKVRRLVVIVVNAKTGPDTEWDRKEAAPGVKDVLSAVVDAPMANYSFETIELMQERFKQWTKDYQSRVDCQEILQASCPQATLPGGPLAKVDFYPIVIGFDSLSDPEESRFFKNLGTTFNLPAETIDRLREVAGRLLAQSPQFQRLLNDLRAAPD
ncbi:MAG: patatin-like phospholipase family protein [candidate division NC10 bacterium]